MKDKDFEVDMERRFTFKTFSEGWSNAHEINMAEDEFNEAFNRHIKKFREWCEKYL